MTRIPQDSFASIVHAFNALGDEELRKLHALLGACTAGDLLDEVYTRLGYYIDSEECEGERYEGVLCHVWSDTANEWTALPIGELEFVES